MIIILYYYIILLLLYAACRRALSSAVGHRVKTGFTILEMTGGWGGVRPFHIYTRARARDIKKIYNIILCELRDKCVPHRYIVCIPTEKLREPVGVRGQVVCTCNTCLLSDHLPGTCQLPRVCMMCMMCVYGVLQCLYVCVCVCV